MAAIVFVVMILAFALINWMLAESNQNLSKAHRYFDTGVIFLLLIGHICTAAYQVFNPLEEYYQPIDPVNTEYTPIALAHIKSFLLFYSFNLAGSYYIWKKGKQLPPLTFTLAICVMIYWTVICIFWSIQLIHHSDPHEQVDNTFIWPMQFVPIGFILFNTSLFIRVIKSQSSNRIRDQYKNKFLNYLNNKLIDSQKTSTWILVLFIPFLLMILCILMLFGQYPDSMIKVFTDTTTWTLSQKSHPPFLDHQGHYLCTVAACGSPRIVKPQRIGSRHGHPIIVNRQLSVANAFESILETQSPKIHRFIRRNYDKYGYPLSKKITGRFGSNLTYLIMKPLEWLFLLVIYLFSTKPEELISRQYRNDL